MEPESVGTVADKSAQVTVAKGEPEADASAMVASTASSSDEQLDAEEEGGPVAWQPGRQESGGRGGEKSYSEDGEWGRDAGRCEVGGGESEELV